MKLSPTLKYCRVNLTDNSVPGNVDPDPVLQGGMVVAVAHHDFISGGLQNLLHPLRRYLVVLYDLSERRYVFSPGGELHEILLIPFVRIGDFEGVFWNLEMKYPLTQLPLT